MTRTPSVTKETSSLINTTSSIQASPILARMITRSVSPHMEKDSSEVKAVVSEQASPVIPNMITRSGSTNMQTQFKEFGISSPPPQRGEKSSSPTSGVVLLPTTM